jgi:hypothetical protein
VRAWFKGSDPTAGPSACPCKSRPGRDGSAERGPIGRLDDLNWKARYEAKVREASSQPVHPFGAMPSTAPCRMRHNR